MSFVVPNRILFANVCDLLSQGKTVIIEVKGCSMLPFIVGDRDSVKLAQTWWGVGDAVLSKLPNGEYVLHRVKKIDGEKVLLKGDGNLKGTEICALSDVKGKVVEVLKKGRHPVDVSKSSYRVRVKMWNALPYLMRRVVLAVYRRSVLLKEKKK